MRKLYIRIAPGANVPKTISYIRETLTSIDPDYETQNSEISPYEQELAQQYRLEKIVATMITLFTTIAIIISVMGIFGIVLFDTERRRKEIGIRKVNGATVVEILEMFNRKYFILTAICSAIAIPLAYVVVSAYLGGFAYHYEINAWPFILGVLITMAITTIVVSAASFKAANENPVKTLTVE